jgi:hypothetical protein
MLRRDFVYAFVSASIAPKLLLSQTASPLPPPPAPVPWTLGLNPKTPLPHTEVVDAVAETEGQFFTAQQMATLRRLCDLLLPPIGGKPGATQAGTPLFLDFLIGSSPDPRKRLYKGGLEWLDGETQKTHHVPFAKLSDEQAGALLNPWLRSWMSDHPPTEAHADFVNIAHDDIRTATVNSQAWSEIPSGEAQESTPVGLYWSPIEPDIYGTNPEHGGAPVHVLAAPKTSHPIPEYSR